jgi:outer membrane lipoprotein-sorting protein
MLMIALVVVLIATLSSVLYTILPTARDPSITILMSNDRQNITLWHKGGDWIRREDLSVVVGNGTGRTTFSSGNGNLVLVPEKPVFDLGSNITVRLSADLQGDETVKLVTPRAVVFSGRVGL